jgi:hypothetical protein
MIEVRVSLRRIRTVEISSLSAGAERRQLIELSITIPADWAFADGAKEGSGRLACAEGLESARQKPVMAMTAVGAKREETRP